MPLRIGLVLYPLIPLALVLMRRGPVSKFYRAGAVSLETARRPASIEATGDLQSALRSGVLRHAGEGRYFVDVATYRRRQKWINAGIVASVVLGAALALLAWSPWR